MKGGVYMKYSSRLRSSLIQELVDILARLNPVEIVTPANVADAKENWIRDVNERRFFRNPTFVYDEQKLVKISNYYSRLIEIKYHLRHNVLPESALDQAIFDIIMIRIKQGILATELAASIRLEDDIRTSAISQRIYGDPSTIQIIKCYDVINGNTFPFEGISPSSSFSENEQKQLKSQKFNAAAIEKWFTAALDYYDIPNWNIEIGEQFSAIDVRTKNSSGQPTIAIPAKRTVNGLKLLELIGHEIESHLRSVENARSLFLEHVGSSSPLAPLALIFAKSDDELLDEGQAKLSDVRINGLEAIPTVFYSIAIDQARRGHSFSDVAETIFGLCVDKAGDSHTTAASRSWTYTYRIFRGATDTSATKGYYFPKDYVYLAGYNTAKIVNPTYLEFASVGLSELDAFFATVDIDAIKSKYPNRDAVQ